MAIHLPSDSGNNFNSKLTEEFKKRMGCSPRFNSPWHPSSTGLVERAVGNVKKIVSKLAIDHVPVASVTCYSFVDYLESKDVNTCDENDSFLIN